MWDKADKQNKQDNYVTTIAQKAANAQVNLSVMEE